MRNIAPFWMRSSQHHQDTHQDSNPNADEQTRSSSLVLVEYAETRGSYGLRLTRSHLLRAITYASHSLLRDFVDLLLPVVLRLLSSGDF